MSVALFPPPCQAESEGLNVSSVFHNISLSTVMSCEGKQKCSLHLRVKTVLQLHGKNIKLFIMSQYPAPPSDGSCTTRRIPFHTS